MHNYPHVDSRILRRFLVNSRYRRCEADGVTYLQYLPKQDKIPNLYRLVAFDKNQQLGSGNFGVVYNARSFHYQIGRNSPEERKIPKVVKVFTNPSRSTLDSIEREYKHGKRANHLRMRKPIFFDNGNTCYLIMNKVPGENFNKILDKLRKLSTNQKLELTYNLLLALRDQVTAQNTVHRDINPNNIIVSKSNLKVYIIDFGAAVNNEELAPPQCTPGFMDPELLNPLNYHKNTCKNDVFSIARIIGMLWCTEEMEGYVYNSFIGIEETKNAAKTMRKNCTNKKIKPWLTDLLNPKITGRPDIHQAITNFAEIFPEIAKPTPKTPKNTIFSRTPNPNSTTGNHDAEQSSIDKSDHYRPKG